MHSKPIVDSSTIALVSGEQSHNNNEVLCLKHSTWALSVEVPLECSSICDFLRSSISWEDRHDVPQFCSSDKSPQSLSPSQTHRAGIQRPVLAHWNWSSRHATHDRTRNTRHCWFNTPDLLIPSSLKKFPVRTKQILSVNSTALATFSNVEDCHFIVIGQITILTNRQNCRRQLLITKM